MDVADVVWIAGPAGAGKSTIARLLARRRGLRWYSMDHRIWQHRARAIASGLVVPIGKPDSYDRSPMVFDDLRDLPDGPTVVVEGADITPDMVRFSRHAIWLLPSREEQLRRLSPRYPGGVHHGLLYGRELVMSQIRGRSVESIVVDGQKVEETLRAVESRFATVISRGPKASTVTQRRDLLRYVNRASLDHSILSLEHRDPGADIKKVARVYECECGDAACADVVEISIARAAELLAYSPPAILSASHATD